MSNFFGNNKKDSSKHNRKPYERPSRSAEDTTRSSESYSPKGIISNVKESVAELLSNSWLAGWVTPTSSRNRRQDADTANPGPSTSGLRSEDNQNFHSQGDVEPIASTSKDILPSFDYASSKPKIGKALPKLGHPFISSTPAIPPTSSRESHKPIMASSPVMEDVEEVSIITNSSELDPFKEVTPRRSLLQSSLEGHHTRKRPRAADFDVGNSLFSQSGTQESALASKRPRFNLSATEPPRNASQSFNTSSNSIFYPGKTMYGGASNYRRSRGTPQRVLTHHQIKPTPAVESASSSDDGGLSLAAKKILDCLDRMSTPLSEAKRIPTARNRLEFFESPSYVADFHKNRPSLKTPSSAPPSSKLLTPSQATIKSNLSKFIEKQCEKAKEVEATIEKETSEPQTPKSQPQVTKSPQPSQPSVVAKPVSTSTTKSFSFGALEKAPEMEKTAPSVKEKPVPVISPPVSMIPPMKTSQPMSISTFNHNISEKTKPMKPNKDSFKARVKKGVSTLDETPLVVPDLPQVSLPVFNMPKISFSSIPKSSASSDGDDFQFSKPEVVGTFVEDVSEEESITEFSFSEPLPENGAETPAKPEVKSPLISWDKFKPAKGSWECRVCCVMNKQDAPKCVACETNNPNSETQNVISLSDPSIAFQPAPQTSLPPSVSSKVLGNFGNLFKNPPVDGSKAVPSETPKQPPQSVETVPAVKGFGDLFKKQSGQWECSTCMIQNKSDVVKCVACETPKDGQTLPDQSKPFTPGEFSFPSKSNDFSSSAFKFGVQNTTTSQSESSKPVASTNASGFTFGVSKTSSSVATSKPAASFSFGGKPSEAAATTTTTQSSGFSFGVASTTVPTTTEANPFASVLKPPQSKKETPSSKEPFSFGVKTNGIDTKKKEITSLNNNIESKPKAPAVFAFGQTHTTELQPKSTGGLASDSSTAQSNGFKETNSATASSGLFQFGSNAASKPGAAFAFGSTTDSKTTKAANLSFGAVPKSSDTGSGKGVSFSAGSNAFTFGGTPKPAEPPSYQDSTKASVFSAPESTSIPPTFSFGQVAESAKPAAGVFAFGSSNNNDPKPSAGFNFGSSQSLDVNPSFGQAPSSGMMQFRGSSMTSDAAIKKTSAEANPFSITTANPFNSLSSQKEAPPGRVIRKAIRRNRK